MKLVILDRDGIINHDSDDFIKSPDEWMPIPGASRRSRGSTTPAGTSWSRPTSRASARGLFDMASLNAIHAGCTQRWPQVGGRIDAVFFCPHAPDDDCDCRKPQPGLLERDRRALRRRAATTCRWSATRCATCRPARPPAASRTWCSPARAPRLDDAAAAPRSCAGAAGTQVHADLAAFADFLLAARAHARRRRRARLGVRGCADAPRARAAALGAVPRCGWSSRWCRGRSCGAAAVDLRARRRRCTGCCVGWLRLAIWGARVICGVQRARARAWRTCRGQAAAAILLPKHQSTWETFAFPTLMPHPLATCSSASCSTSRSSAGRWRAWT